MYRVGFGDFFLVTVPTPSGDQYILIDCGVFRGTSGTGDLGSIVEAVEDMYQTTKGHLALVIMTHRHADHISGFSKARRFEDFTTNLVWMPYWEQLNDGKDSPHSLQIDIQGLAENLAMQFRGRDDPEAREALAQLANATGIEDFTAVASGKKRSTSIATALHVLKNYLGDNGKKVRYYAARDKPELPAELQGLLQATILGPPPPDAKAFMALKNLKKRVGQYLDSTMDSDEGPRTIQPFPGWTADPEQFQKTDTRGLPIDYKSVSKRIDNAQPDMLAAAADKIETFLNNQSLVVLFEFGDKKLLFAGDAQAGSWEYWLFNLDEPVRDPTKAGDIIERSKELLQTIDFYKVGHHGSTNATPIQAIAAATARPESSNGFVSMCSTEGGVYGNCNLGTEVPRIPLMKALGDASCLIRSDSFPITITKPEKKVIQSAEGVKLPKPKAGEVKVARLYIEYSF